LFKVDTPYYSLEKSQIEYVKFAYDIYGSIKLYVEQKGLAVSFKSDFNEQILFIDGEKVERILLNLLSNAIKYNKHQGTISVEIWKDEKFVYTDISDTGVGIPKDKIVHLFKKFYQVKPKNSVSKEGTGIGLYLSKRIATMHGGDITVTSTPGEGSKFSLLLPISTNDKVQDIQNKERICDDYANYILD
jgi:signal transduction histidine kinase